MELLTEEIKESLRKYPLYSQDGKRENSFCSAKFFFPSGAWTWYITEANLETGELFGVTINAQGEAEWGYISLSELESVRVMSLGVERDVFFEPRTLKEIKDPYLQKLFQS